MNFAKQKYKAVVTHKWGACIVYGKNLDELNEKINGIKERHPSAKTYIYTRDDEAETPAFAQWRLIDTQSKP